MHAHGMLTAHASAGFLISQAIRPNGRKLKTAEVALIMFGAVMFDLDLVVLSIFKFPGGVHHSMASHTPLAGLIYWLILWLTFRKKFPKEVFWGLGAAMLSHFVLDDWTRWMALVGLRESFRPNINWFYPFDPKMTEFFAKSYETNLAKGLPIPVIVMKYLREMPDLVISEMVINVAAAGVWIRNFGLKLVGKSGRI